MRDHSTQAATNRVEGATPRRSGRTRPRFTVDRALSFCIQWSPRNEDVAFVTGWLVDIGAGGMRLHGPVPVRPGWRVRLLFLLGDRPPELVSGRVAWARQTGAGCSFGLSAPVDGAFLKLIRSDSSRPAARVA